MFRKPQSTLAAVILGFATISPVAAEVRTVGKANSGCPSPQYPTIQAALTAASAGDEIAICPGTYAEQLVISKALTLRGTPLNGVGRVLIRPAPLNNHETLPAASVITVVNTEDVTIEDLAIDASNNNVDGCNVALAGIRFLNSSGWVRRSAIFGAELKQPRSCPGLFPGNGFGVRVDSDRPGSYWVAIENNSIRNYTRNGILVMGAGVTAEIRQNTIAGKGPAADAFQFGVFIANGAVARVSRNVITQANCGSLLHDPCHDLRSEGVVLRAVGDGTVVEGNIISNVQSGVFINGGNRLRILNNLISNVDVLSGIHVQGMTDSLVAMNQIFNVGPFDDWISENQEGCGINVVQGAGNARNTYAENLVSDAYCGVAFVSSEMVVSGVYVNTLYETLNADNYVNRPFPPPVLP